MKCSTPNGIKLWTGCMLQNTSVLHNMLNQDVRTSQRVNTWLVSVTLITFLATARTCIEDAKVVYDLCYRHQGCQHWDPFSNTLYCLKQSILHRDCQGLWPLPTVFCLDAYYRRNCAAFELAYNLVPPSSSWEEVACALLLHSWLRVMVTTSQEIVYTLYNRLWVYN